ncbi:MAG: DsbE family thiol:disulfide interchange protein [Sphingomonas sp.]|uniref:DsbE family thiol:disulfide interchange protein n=1 Tax=Sphingomonas sp. TaxID=28214 RepID=UPI001796530F|nr:DsbE family thiol:disulfide interchange protein [Sphingomonas sp.]MBA3668411.1 DsbE family thiol:disulfide interchange protein [Sphingomonas sp.]
MSHRLRFLPLLLLVVFVGAVAWRLANPMDERIASRMIGQQVPAFALSPAVPGKPGLASADLVAGQPRLVNVFASWCVPCVAEAPLLLELNRRGVPIEAVAVRDKPQDVASFLARHGDPFGAIGSDADSRVQLDLGSSGVPETFVVDGRGVIRYQHMGPIEPGDLTTIQREWEAAR